METRRYISEADLLKCLDIPSFRHMTKDKLASFVAQFPYVDPDVARKALEQFPDLASAMVEIVGHYRDVISECLVGSDKDTRLCLEECSAILNLIQGELGKNDLEPEERARLIDQAIQVATMMREIDRDGKRFRTDIIRTASAVACIVACVLISALGVNAKISLPDLGKAANKG